MTDRIPLADLTPDRLTALYDELETYRNAPVLRNCLVPGCLRQYDARAGLAGHPPARPSWSAEGWHTLGTGSAVHPAGGHICPDHAALIAAHMPQRDEQLREGRVFARCSCGDWSTGGWRWHGAARGLWEEHLLTAAEALPIPAASKETDR